MTKQFLFYLIAFFSASCLAQIKGKVSNLNKDPLASVNIYIDNTFTGTTSNDNGNYELNIDSLGSYTIVFQYLGYTTLKQNIEIKKFPYELNVSLKEEEILLKEVVVNSDENPANSIIRSAIANREKNLSKINSYTANFYSRGLIRIKDAPEKVLGQELGDLGGGLDSTRSGIIYLSETISKLRFLKPNNLKETIVASKVSGDDNGFSFNAALDVDFNFYFNTVELGNEIISPIADYAFNYYNYKLLGVFYDDKGHLINKIQVIPKRKNDKVFSGTIYIVEDYWSIYALELRITGNQAQIPAADSIKLSQSYSFSESDDLWALFSQRLDFEYGLFGVKGNGAFNAVYSDYNFEKEIDSDTFDKEILSFVDDANKKDSIYWSSNRPIPLTDEEISDYLKKDSIQILRESKPYLDSIDREANAIKIMDVLSSYDYQNSYNNYSWGIRSPIQRLKFNTVQGFNSDVSFFFRKNYDEFRRYIQLDAAINYGEADKRLLPSISATFKFNNIKRNTLSMAMGIGVQQFNSGLGSLERLNTFYSLLAEKNYLKLYENRYVQIGYFQEVFNGLRMSVNGSYQHRLPRFNTTDQVWFNPDDRQYTSNNPLDTEAYDSPSFSEHTILKLNLNAAITFGQRYMSYPNSKFNIPNDSYPNLSIGYEMGLASNRSNYNFQQITARINQTVNLKNKGSLRYNFKFGTFFNADDIAFIDFQHFNGNQTNIGSSFRYTNVFNNMPYYEYSTNKSYAELHLEQDFGGFILGKVPLINKLNYNLIVGGHLLSTQDRRPYKEITIGLDNIGWGKLRFLRLDYVRSYSNGFNNDALIFGVKLLNFLE